ncbi:MAG: hypothetical protein MUC92_13320 [Fimbriimonadaceae bacterium]|nr:hypothetical protein [Fimbriimonadaceae bacterium]
MEAVSELLAEPGSILEKDSLAPVNHCLAGRIPIGSGLAREQAIDFGLGEG